MSDITMTDKQLQELHDDIRDGISMIVETKHYHDLETENKQLKELNIVFKDARGLYFRHFQSAQAENKELKAEIESLAIGIGKVNDEAVRIRLTKEYDIDVLDNKIVHLQSLLEMSHRMLTHVDVVFLCESNSYSFIIYFANPNG